MTRVAIIAAMPGELKPLVRGWKRESRNSVEIWSWHHTEGEWIAACAGIGAKAAEQAFAEIEKEGAIDLVFSTGWAGALQDDLVAGRAYRVSGVIDAHTGKRTRTANTPGDCWLVTDQKVADRTAKLRLAAEYGASLVDMEAAGVASLAGRLGIPFLCIKGVSDSPADRLPDFNGFISKNGRFQMVRFVVSSILCPWRWAGLVRMGRNCRKAAQRLGEELLNVLDERGTLRRPNGYSNPKR